MAEAQQDQQQALPNQQHPPTQQQVDSNGTKENGNGTPGTKRTRPADEHAGNGSAGNGAPKGLYPLQIGHRTFKSGLEAKTFFTSFTKNFALGVTINTVSGSIISCAFLLRSLRPSTAPIPTSRPCELVLTPTFLATSVRERVPLGPRQEVLPGRWTRQGEIRPLARDTTRARVAVLLTDAHGIVPPHHRPPPDWPRHQAVLRQAHEEVQPQLHRVPAHGRFLRHNQHSQVPPCCMLGPRGARGQAPAGGGLLLSGGARGGRLWQRPGNGPRPWGRTRRRARRLRRWPRRSRRIQGRRPAGAWRQ